MNRTTLTIVLIALPLIIGTIALVSVLISVLNNSSGNESQSEESTVKPFTLSQVAEHNSTDDCWIVIESKVYDVTNFLTTHPGGAERIMPHCGQDASTAFATQDGTGGTHSSMAHRQLESLRVGVLSEEDPTPTPSPSPSHSTPSASQDED